MNGGLLQRAGSLCCPMASQPDQGGGISPPGMSMSDQSLKSKPATSTDTISATSLPASAAGHSPCASPEFLTTARSGPDRRHAQMSVLPAPSGECAAALRESVRHWLDRGLISSTTFCRAVSILRTCQVSKSGYPKSRDVWRKLATAFTNPNERLLILVALVYAGECGLLPTVTARDWKSPGRQDHPRISTSTRGEPLPETFGLPLPTALAGWLMGFPPEWMQYAPLETPSIHGSQPGSSGRQ